MKSLNELRTRRDEVAGRMKELWEACERDRSKLEAEEAKEFDSLKKELGELDGSIEDEAAVERAVKGAVPVVPSAITSQRSGSSARQGRQEDRPKLDPAQKGVAFAQVAKVKWLAKKHNVDPRNIADQMGSRIDPRVAPFLKAAVAGGSVTGSTWGSQLVGDETGVVADFYEFLRPQTILGKFGTGGIPNMTRVPFRVPLAGVTDGGDGYWVGEGAAKPLTAFAFARTTLEPLKVASLCVVTKELLEDSSPAADALLRDLLAGALRERKDRDFIDPTNAGTASIKPASITNAATPIAASGTGDADDVRTDVRAAMQGFIDANNPPTTGVWIMSASTALALSLMQNALGQSEFAGVSMNGGMFAGLPVITSQYVPGGTAGYYVVLANAADIYYGDTGDITVDTSEHATIEMSDNPDGEVGTNVGMFQTNRVAFRAEQRLDWALRRATAVQVISGANWGEA